MRYRVSSHSKPPHAEDMEKEINLFAPSSASRFRDARVRLERERRAKCTFAYSRVIPEPASFSNHLRRIETPQTASTCCTRQGARNDISDKRRWLSSHQTTTEKWCERLSRAVVVAEISFAGLIMMSRSSDTRMMNRQSAKLMRYAFARLRANGILPRLADEKWSGMSSSPDYNETFYRYIGCSWRVGHISETLFHWFWKEQIVLKLLQWNSFKVLTTEY